MASVLRRLRLRGDAFFAKEWRILAYQPALYLFIWAASIRLWIDNDPPPNFTPFFSDDFYGIWLYLGIAGPMIALWSWFWIVKHTHRKRFLGMWLRLSGDLMVFTNLLTFHLASVFDSLSKTLSEARIFSRYVFAASLLFVLALLIRDVWTLVVMERLAARIHAGDE